MGTASGYGASTADRGADAIQTEELEQDSILMRVDVHPNGTATWQIEYRIRLNDGNTATAFEGLQADIRENPDAYSAGFFRGINQTIASAERSTGREMAGEHYGVHTEVRQLPQRYGVVVYSFQWAGFAAVDDGELRVGDALSGFFLDEGERLLVSWPERYEATEIRPEPEPDPERESAVLWTGPVDFDESEPRILLSPPAPVSLPPLPLAVAALVAIGAGAALWWVRGRDGSSGERPTIGIVGDGNGEPNGELSPELLSNEERVIRLLERRGGRVKQRDVVDELGWTEAKTSQVIGSLREEGKLESFRLGRENVLSIPDFEDGSRDTLYE